MNINQLTAGALLPSTSSTNTQKISASNIHAPALVSTVESNESEEQIKQAVQKIQGAVDNLAQNNLRFSVDEDTGKTIIKVMDVQTEEVIRQIPTKEAVEIARTLNRVHGLLFNDKA